MDKRLLIVISLCLAIVLGSRMLFPPTPPKRVVPPTPPAAPAADPAAQPSANTANTEAPKPQTKKPDSAPLVSTPARAEKEQEIVLSTGQPGTDGYYRALFSNRGAVLVDLATGNYFDRVGLSAEERADLAHWTRLVTQVETPNGKTASMALATSASSQSLAPTPLTQELWQHKLLGPADHPTGIEFTLSPGSGVTFVKRFLFRPGEYQIGVELELVNDAIANPVGALGFVLTPAACVPPKLNDSFYPEPQGIAVSRGKGDEKPRVDSKTAKVTTDGAYAVDSPLSFAGVQEKYFAVLLHGANESAQHSLIGASSRRVYDQEAGHVDPQHPENGWRQLVTDVQLELSLPAQGEKRTWSYVLYAGPKDPARMEAAWADHTALVRNDQGIFHGIASVLLSILNFFQRITGNWGVAIILLTLTVRTILFPINRRSQTAMARYQAKMKRLQPKIDELKKRLEKDPSKLRAEQAKLMQAEGAFPPLGGCLPMFLQIPVFFGLFAALKTSFDLRQAPFLFWIHDLSLPDHLMYLGWGGPANYLNVLPPLMVVAWIWQQKGMPLPADEQAARMQKMMMWMPAVMGIFLYNYAAGLSLYMITQSGLGLIEQKVIKKYWPLDDKEQPKKKGGIFAKLAELQEKQTQGQQRARKS